MDGIIVRRGDLYVARISAKSSFYDSKGNLWSKELQAARVFTNMEVAAREARRIGGEVKRKKDGRLEE